MAVGDKGINIMRVASVPKTITYSGTNMASYYPYVYNGNKVDISPPNGTYSHQRSFGGGVNTAQTFKVEFSTPIYALSIGAYGLSGWGDNGVPEGGDSGYTQVYINGNLVYSTGESGGTKYETETPQLITSIEIRVGGSQSGGDWWSECACSIAELEIYIADDPQGVIL